MCPPVRSRLYQAAGTDNVKEVKLAALTVPDAADLAVCNQKRDQSAAVMSCKQACKEPSFKDREANVRIQLCCEILQPADNSQDTTVFEILLI